MVAPSADVIVLQQMWNNSPNTVWVESCALCTVNMDFRQGTTDAPSVAATAAPVALEVAAVSGRDGGGSNIDPRVAVAAVSGGDGYEPAVEVSAARGGDGAQPEVRGIRIRPNRCPLVRCMLACRYGFQRGEDGCPKCRCNPAPSPTLLPDGCPRFRCMIACQYGFQTDERGCTTCRCNPPPTPLPELCRNRPMCRMACPNGFETDEDLRMRIPFAVASPPYQKLPVPCRNRPMCRMACPNGFETDEDGCPICRCKPTVPEPPNCSPWMCMMWCEHGFQIGPDGCEICRCNRPPMELEAAAAIGTDSLIQPLFTPQEGTNTFRVF